MAIHFSNKMLRSSILYKDRKKQAISLTSLATIFMQNGLYNDALKYNIKACRLYKIVNDTTSIAASNYNIGLAFLNLNKKDRSIHYFFKSIELLKKKPKQEFQVIVYGTIADYYLNNKDFKNWEKYQLVTNNLANKIGNLQLYAMGLTQLGKFALENKNYLKAYLYLKNANNTLLVKPYISLQIKIDSLLYVITKNQNKYNEALFWHEKFTNLQNSIFTKKQIETLNKAYAEIETIKKTKIIFAKEQELNKFKNNLYLFIGLLSVLIIVSVFYFSFRKKIKTYQKRLFLKNKELVKQIELSKINHFLNNKEIKTLELFQKIISLIENKKLYLNPDLNVKFLQQQIGTNKKYLYEAISKHSGTNFRGFINQYRVNEAIKYMEEKISAKSPFNINEIFNISGFNSVSTFFRVFKQHTGLSPNEYIIQLKNEKF